MKRWPLRPIGDLLERVVKPVKIEPDREYREIGIRSHCRGIFHKPPVTGQQLGSKRVYWVEPGCFTVNIVFAWEQAVALTTPAEQGMIASHRFPMYRAINGHLLPEYAHLYFSSPRGKYDLGIASPGGAGRNKTLGQEEFKRLELPVPPIPQQRKVVDIMNTWKAAIASSHALIEAKKRFRRELLRTLLRQKGGQSRQLEFSSIAERQRDKFDPTTSSKDIRCIELEHISAGDGRLLGSTSSKNQDSLKNSFRKGDVLFGKLRPYLRKFYLADSDGVCSSEIWVLRANAHICEPNFLFYLVQSDEFIRAANVTSGSKMPRADWEVVSELPVILPPLAKQRQIASILRSSDREIELLIARLHRIEKQRQGLLQALLQSKVSPG